MDERQIVASNSIDTPKIRMEDYVPEIGINVYPYKAIFDDIEATFVQGGTSSNIRVTQEVDSFKNLEKDDNGFKYFKIYASMVDDTKLTIASGTPDYHKQLKKLKTFSGITNSYFSTDDSAPYFFTIKEPLDISLFNSGKQEVYWGDEFKPTYQETDDLLSESEDLSRLLEGDEYHLSSMRFLNLSELLQQYDNASIKFTFSDLRRDVVQTDGKKDGIVLRVDNDTLIGFVKGKGVLQILKKNTDSDSKTFPYLTPSGQKTNDKTAAEVVLEKKTQFNFDLNDIYKNKKQRLMPFKGVPIETQERVSLFSDWNDYDVVVPFYKILNNKTTSLSQYFSKEVGIDSNGDNIDQTTDDDYMEDRHLIEDMLFVGYAFADNWSFANVLSGTNQGNAGKISPNDFIGWNRIRISNIANQNPMDVIDSLVEKHLRSHPKLNDEKYSVRFKKLKAMIVSVSRWIYSSYAIGRGENNFHQIYLPWFYDIDFQFNPQSVSDGSGDSTKVYWYLDDPTNHVNSDGSEMNGKPFNIPLVAKTSYFNKDFGNKGKAYASNNFELASGMSLSRPKLLQTDRKIILPEIPEQLQELDKMPLPSDIDTSSSNDLKYIWYSPIMEFDSVKDFYQGNPVSEIKIPAGTVIDIPAFSVPNKKHYYLNNGVSVNKYLDSRIGLREISAFDYDAVGYARIINDEQEYNWVKEINEYYAGNRNVNFTGQKDWINEYVRKYIAGTAFYSPNITLSELTKNFDISNLNIEKLFPIYTSNGGKFDLSNISTTLSSETTLHKTRLKDMFPRVSMDDGSYDLVNGHVFQSTDEIGSGHFIIDKWDLSTPKDYLDWGNDSNIRFENFFENIRKKGVINSQEYREILARLIASQWNKSHINDDEKIDYRLIDTNSIYWTGPTDKSINNGINDSSYGRWGQNDDWTDDGKDNFVHPNEYIHWQLKENVISGVKVKFESDTTIPISTINNSQVVFDKNDFSKKISNIIVAGNTSSSSKQTNQSTTPDGKVDLFLVEEEGYSIKYIEEIQICMLWNNDFEIVGSTRIHKYESVNEKDETITTKRIKFI